jgi:hypothetical protein
VSRLGTLESESSTSIKKVVERNTQKYYQCYREPPVWKLEEYSLVEVNQAKTKSIKQNTYLFVFACPTTIQYVYVRSAKMIIIIYFFIEIC